jgi:hypothetical protein
MVSSVGSWLAVGAWDSRVGGGRKRRDFEPVHGSNNTYYKIVLADFQNCLKIFRRKK